MTKFTVTYYVPDTVLSVLHKRFSLILTKAYEVESIISIFFF